MFAFTTLFIILIASLFVFVLGCVLWFWLPADRQKTLMVVDAFIFSVWLLIFLLLTSVFEQNTHSVAPWLFIGLFCGLTAAVIGVARVLHAEMTKFEGTSRLADSLKQDKKLLEELDLKKTEFLSLASHQLRTPLSIIKGYVELLSDGSYGKVSPKIKKVLRNVDITNERLIHLVDEFLCSTRMDQGDPVYTMKRGVVGEIITSVVTELRERAAQKKIDLKWRPTKLPTTQLDFEKIRHVIYNFIDNAIKYSDHGTIRVSAKIVRGQILVEIVDQGIGFTPSEAEHFFEKFYRSENARQSRASGTGLGLYVCQRFVQGHGGQVGASSRGPGKGSTFWLSLPIQNHRLLG